jgi:hypothetical protein
MWIMHLCTQMEAAGHSSWPCVAVPGALHFLMSFEQQLRRVKVLDSSSCMAVRTTRCRSVGCLHLQEWVETERACYLIRQHVYASLSHRLGTRPFLSHLEKVKFQDVRP